MTDLAARAATLRARRAAAEEAADAAFEERMTTYCRQAQRQVIREHPSPSRRPHPSGLVTAPPIVPVWARRLWWRVRRAWLWAVDPERPRVFRGSFGCSRGGR